MRFVKEIGEGFIELLRCYTFLIKKDMGETSLLR